MADIFTAAFRSDIMKRVRRERTTEEQLLYAALRRAGLRARRNIRDLPGKPDLAILDCKLSIFVDGDFWHGRAWFERHLAPKSNRRFWIDRFKSNKRRDRRVDRQLRRLGWSTMRVWGSSVRKDADRVATRIAQRTSRLSHLSQPKSLRRTRKKK